MFIIIKDLFRHDFRFAFAVVVLSMLILLSLISFFSPHHPEARHVADRDLVPSLQHPLGTNSRGQDIFWLISHSIRNSLIMGGLTAIISICIGTFVGLIAGYKGGLTDRILMTVNDSLIVLPVLPVLILVSAMLADMINLIMLAFILSFFSWPWGGRQVRSQVLSLREREFTYTAIFSGMTTFKVAIQEYLPFVLPWVMANFINTILWAIGMETTLAIFGLSSLETPTIGTTIFWALDFQAILREKWLWIGSPIISGALLFVSLYMLSSSIGAFIDPKKRVQVRLGKEGVSA